MKFFLVFGGSGKVKQHLTVYINKPKKIYAYYTLEESYDGYMQCSTDAGRHYILGKREDMSKVEFLKEMCRILEIKGKLMEKKKVVKM